MQDIELVEVEEAQMQDEAQAEANRNAMAEQVATRLQGIADARVIERIEIERRWVEDELQYKGEYEQEVKDAIRPGASKAYYNGTRKLCEFAESRMAEMCLPTSTGRNFSVAPTPIPDLPPEMAAASEQIMAIATERAGKMQKVLDDQLAECDYTNEARKALHDAVRLGTGVLKGPIVRMQTIRRYMKQEMPMGMGVEFAMQSEQKPTAALEWVSIWDFFPDMSAATVDNCENFLERHWLTRKQLRDLANLPGFNVENIRELAKNSPGYHTGGEYKQQLSDSNKQASTVLDQRYQVWEFNGSLPYEDYKAIALDTDEAEDPLSDVRVIVWFCDGKVLKAIPCEQDDDTPLYSVFQWGEDSHNIHGKGLPRMVRNGARVANSALRMLLDNGAFSIIPQRIINRNLIEPVNGSYEITPGKEWLYKGQGNPADAFKSEGIPTNIAELMQLFEMAKTTMQEESGIQMLAQTGQEPQVTQTATGTAMLMNSAATPLRDKVRRFDSQVTNPRVMAMYRWNMRFNEDDSIKGDYNVIAMGSTSLLMREQRMQGLMHIASMAQQSPIFGPLTKWPELYRELVGAMEINADGFVLSDEEIKAKQQQQGEGKPDPTMIKLQIEQGKLQLAGRQQEAAEAELQMTMQSHQIAQQLDARKLEVQEFDSKNDLLRTQIQADREAQRIQSQRDLMLAKLAAESQRTVQQIQAQLGIKRMDLDSKHQLFNAEAQIKAQTGRGI